MSIAVVIGGSSAYHYDDVIMTMVASQITSLTVVYSIVYSGVNQRKHQSSASLAFVREIHRGPVNFPHKWPVTRKMFPFDDVIMWSEYNCPLSISLLMGVQYNFHMYAYIYTHRLIRVYRLVIPDPIPTHIFFFICLIDHSTKPLSVCLHFVKVKRSIKIKIHNLQ